MDRPEPEELAAIAAAYAILARARAARAVPERSRWRLSAEYAEIDSPRARVAARARSRWTIAARLDG